MSSFVVVCTYGNTISNAPFAAGIPDIEQAEKLKAVAVSKGYLDAEVITAREFKDIRAAAQRRWASKRGAEEASR